MSRDRSVAPRAAPRTTAAPGAPLSSGRARQVARDDRRDGDRGDMARCCQARRRPPATRPSAAEGRRGGWRKVESSDVHGASISGRARGSVRRSCQLLETTESVRQAHLLRRPGLDPEQIGGGDDDRDAACPGGRHVEPVPAVQEVHAARRQLGRRGRHRVDADRRLLPLELVDGPDPGFWSAADGGSRRPGRCTGRR